MIPLWLTLQVHSAKGKNVRLGLPLFLLWLLLPLVILLLPLALLAGPIFRFNPFRALAAGWSVLSAIPGTHVDVAAPRARVFIHVY